ncbi:MAG: GYF domain-containing protein [Bdellovibrionota bacterium]
MHLVYIAETFLKLDNNKESVKTSKIAMKALFYDEQTKSWANPFEMDQRTKLDYLLNLNEFNERKWILLKKNTSQRDNQRENEKYEQKGPYSSREIFDMITQSAVRLRDPIWKEGMTKWESIKEVQTFRVLENLSTPHETDVADILSSVMMYDSEMRRVEEKNSSPLDSDEVFMILDDK